MYKSVKISKSKIKGVETFQGETIETKVKRILDNKEPISDGAPPIYTERKDGVLPGYNIRTDRFEVAIEAMDKVASSHIAKREARIVEMQAKKDGGAKPIQGTGVENS